jgi:hypothetical protein
MPIDPLQGFPIGAGPGGNPQQALFQKVADLDRRISDLQTGGLNQATHVSKSDTISTTGTADHAIDLSLDAQIRVHDNALLLVFAKIYTEAPSGGFSITRLQVDAGGPYWGSEGDFMSTTNPIGETMIPGTTSLGTAQSFAGGVPRAFPEIPPGLRTFKVWGKSSNGGLTVFGQRDLWVWTIL